MESQEEATDGVVASGENSLTSCGLRALRDRD